MKNELGLVDKLIVISDMLGNLGYDTEKLTVDELFTIKNALEKVVGKVKLPMKE
jgi:hypothetical protein